MRVSGSFARVLGRVALVVAIAATMLPLGALPAGADESAPDLISFRRISPNVLGTKPVVVIRFSARDTGPAGLAYAMFTYRTPLGAEIRVDSEWMQRASEGTFLATRAVGLWAASGRYVLDKVEVLDREWNSALYERGDRRFDFAAADFTVDNPLEDVTVPRLTSASLFQKEVMQGNPVIALYTADDDVSGVAEVVVTGWAPNGKQWHVRSLPQLGAAGPATWLVPMGSARGVHEAKIILVTDRAGNQIKYNFDGGVYQSPGGAKIPAHEKPDVGSLTFTVLGADEDRAAPTLLRLSRLTPDVRRRNEVAGIEFSAIDHGTGVAEISAEWADGSGHDFHALKRCGDRTNGALSNVIEDFRTIGSEWELKAVRVVDHLGQQTTYARDGSVIYHAGESGPSTHAFDLSLGDFRIEQGAPRDENYENSTPGFCPRIGDVTLDVSDADVTYGDSVTTGGRVTAGDSPVLDPIVAIHQFVGGRPQLIELVRGVAGRYETSFVPKGRGAVLTTFLGAGGPFGADAATSPRVRLAVRPRITATLSAEKVRLGTSTTLSGSVTPPLAGDKVLIQRKTGKGWRLQREVTISSTGTYSATFKPARPGTFRYRVVKPAGSNLSMGHSETVTLVVGS